MIFLDYDSSVKMCDGAGNYSSADHSIPANHPSTTKIAHAWLRWAAKAGFDTKIMAHVAQAAPEPPLSPTEVWQAIAILYETTGHPQPSNLDPEAEQPYRLKILATLGGLTADPDLALLRHMERVPTRIFEPFLSSHQWPPASDHKESEALTQLDLCTGNWKAADEHPQEVSATRKPKPSGPKASPLANSILCLPKVKTVAWSWTASTRAATCLRGWHCRWPQASALPLNHKIAREPS